MEYKEEIVFQLLEQERKNRVERIVEERKITTDDCIVLGIFRLHCETGELREEMHRGMNGLREDMHSEISALREYVYHDIFHFKRAA